MLLRGLVLLGGFNLLLLASQPAAAVQMYVQTSTIGQFGNGSGAYIGHTVQATSDFSNLTAGGTYLLTCAHPATLPVSGERTLLSSRLAPGKNALIVTIPQNQPAIVNITGWAQVPPGTLTCNYRWTAEARESGLNIAVGGVGTSIGNGVQRDGGTVDFEMMRLTVLSGGGRCTP
jgi:hypothetical protein